MLKLSNAKHDHSSKSGRTLVYSVQLEIAILLAAVSFILR